MNPVEYQIMRNVEDQHWWYRGLRAHVSSALRTVQSDSPRRILDIGCGTGGTMSNLSGPDISFTGVDLNTLALQYTRERGLERLAQGSALALPFRDASFDAVLLLDVIYHENVPNPVTALSEARRLLRPGGIVVVNAPAFEWLRSSHDEHVYTARRFTRGGLLEQMRESGFASLRCSYWNTFLFPAIAAVRLLRRNSQRETSDLDGYEESLITRVFEGMLRAERGMMRVTPLPFGVSVFATGTVPE